MSFLLLKYFVLLLMKDYFYFLLVCIFACYMVMILNEEVIVE